MIRALAALALLAAAPAFAANPPLEELKSSVATPVPAVEAPAGARVLLAADLPALVLPDELTVHERIISLTDTFDLKAGGATFGTITEKFFSLAKAFTFVDAKGACVAKARARLLSWGTHIDVTDCADHAVGTIKENVFKSWFKTWTNYSILDASGKEVAISEKVEWISTNLTLTKPSGGAIAELHRPLLNVFSDNWTVKIHDHAAVDARLIVLIAAYKTSVDNDRRQQAADEEKKKDK